MPGEDDLEAQGGATEGATLWASESELKVRFTDETAVSIVAVSDTLFDIFISKRNREVFTHTCAFRSTYNAAYIGVLLIIVKDGKSFKIAESPDSLCVPAYKYEEEKEVAWGRQPSLRVRLLRNRMVQNRPPPQRRVRFAI